MAEPIRNYRDLLVWQKAMQLVDEVDEIVSCLTAYQRFWLGVQMHRASLSIASNIAEGHGADYRRVYLRHLSISKASLTEVETQLLVVIRRRYVEASLVQHALTLTDEIARMLRTLYARLRNKPD